MKKIHPPRWAERFLRWFCDELLYEEIAGDLAEAHHRHLTKYGKRAADRRYVTNVFAFFKPHALERYSRSKQFLPMIDNYFKIALRNIIHRKGFTAVNVGGLVVGIAAVVLIALYLRHEYTYDHHVPEAENVYRLVNNYRDQAYASMPFPAYNSSQGAEQLTLIEHLKGYENVLQACHFVPTASDIGGGGRFYVRMGEQRFVTNNVLITNTGPAFQEIFPREFLLGDPATAFSDFSTLLLSESTAERWFGADWRRRRLLGKEVIIDEDVLTLAGVVRDAPSNAHFDYELILHQASIPSWGAYTYFKTTPETAGEAIVARLNAEIDRVYPGYSEDELRHGISAPALTDIHFTPDLLYEIKPVASRAYLSAFAWIGLVILLIIWANYTNLSIAMYADRQRELGMRKVMGALGRDVSIQLMLEAACLALLCLPLIVLAVILVLPAFSELMSITFTWRDVIALRPLAALTALLLLTGAISGAYPAMVYARKSTVRLFGQAGFQGWGSRRVNLRNVLITVQLFLVISLTSLSFFIYQQMRYVATKDLGYNPEGVLYFNLDGTEKHRALGAKLTELPAVKAVGSGGVPGAEMFNQGTYKLKDGATVFSDGTELYVSLGTLRVLDLACPPCERLDAGKEQIFVINRTAAEKLGRADGLAPAELVGATLVTEPEWENEDYGFGIPHPIDGIIDDYNFFSLKYPHQSLLVSIYREVPYAYEMVVKVDTRDLSATLSAIREAYAEVEPERPFEHTFLEQRLAALYENETRAGKLLNVLSLIAVVLAMIGLGGVVAYLAYRRRKEIGIRKVLGASVGSILWRFHREFAGMLLLAVFAALPPSLYVANRWLDDFAFRIEPRIWVVLAAGTLTLLLVLTVITFQARRAAVRPPMEVIVED